MRPEDEGLPPGAFSRTERLVGPDGLARLADAHVAVVGAKKKRSFNTAMCIQASQPGYIPAGNYRMMILPFSLRENALALRKETSYNKLWPAITDLNRRTKVSERGHVEDFLRHYEKELDQFVAEFECVPGQVGAIVLINGRVVGIERAPSNEYWLNLWPALIRECYGSLAIEVAARYPDGPPVPPTRVPMPDRVPGDLDELAEDLEKAREEERARVRNVVEDLLPQPFEVKSEKDEAGLFIDTLTNEQFTGQAVRDGDRVVYFSLVAQASWLKKTAWEDAEPFKF